MCKRTSFWFSAERRWTSWQGLSGSGKGLTRREIIGRCRWSKCYNRAKFLYHCNVSIQDMQLHREVAAWPGVHGPGPGRAVCWRAASVFEPEGGRGSVRSASPDRSSHRRAELCGDISSKLPGDDCLPWPGRETAVPSRSSLHLCYCQSYACPESVYYWLL